MANPSESTEMPLSNHPSPTQHPATQSTIENTPREPVDLSLEEDLQDAQVVGTLSSFEYTPIEPVHDNPEPPSQLLATGTQSTIENTPPEPIQSNPEQPTSGVYAPASRLTDEREPISTLSGSAAPVAHAPVMQSTAELAPAHPHPTNLAQDLEGSETQSATQESNAPRDLVTDRLEDEPELPTINPETGFRVGVTIGRTEIPDSEEVSDWTPSNTSQASISEDPQSTPLRAGVDVPGMVVEDAGEDEPFSSNETFVLINHSDVFSYPASQISSGGRNVLFEEEATTEPTVSQMVIRSSQGGIEGLEGIAERAMDSSRGSNIMFGDMGAAIHPVTDGQRSSGAVLVPKEAVPGRDDDEESFESSIDSHRNDILPDRNFLARRIAAGGGAQSTTSGFLQAKEVDVVMTDSDIGEPDQGGQGQPTTSNGNETTQEEAGQSMKSWPSEFFPSTVRMGQQWPTNRQDADHTAGNGAEFIDDDETASRHSDSIRTQDTQLSGSQQVPKRAMESEDIPDTQPTRSDVQLPSVGGADPHHAPEIQEPQVTKSVEDPPDTTEAPQVTKSVEDSSQIVPDTQPMRPSGPLASAKHALKRSAPDEEEKDGESSIKSSLGTLLGKEGSGINQPLAPLDEEVLPDAPPSSNSIQKPSIVADIPPSPSPPAPASLEKKKGAQSSQFHSSPLKPIDPSSRGKKETPDASQNKDILMAELKAMKISSIQTRIAALEAEIASRRTKLEDVTKELIAPAAGTVKKHIKLLHDYNDIRDVGQGLVGMIADNRGVRIGELYEEFGVGLRD